MSASSQSAQNYWATATAEQRAARTAAATAARAERLRAINLDPQVAAEWIAKQIAKAPTLSEEQRDSLVRLLHVK